jgi:hypothetical protein
LRGILFNRPKVGIGLRGENQFVHRSLFGVLGKRSALDRALLRESDEDFLEGIAIYEEPSLVDWNLHHGFQYNSGTIRVSSNRTDVFGGEKFGGKNVRWEIYFSHQNKGHFPYFSFNLSVISGPLRERKLFTPLSEKGIQRP